MRGWWSPPQPSTAHTPSLKVNIQSVGPGVYWRVSEGFQPSKIDTEAMWSHTVSKVFPSKPSSEQNRPSLVLKEADSVLASSGSARSAYKMPPGTSRTRKYQESYVRETERNI